MWTPRDVEYALCEAVMTMELVKLDEYPLDHKKTNGQQPILSAEDLFALGVSRAEILEGPDKPKLILHPQQEALDRYLDVLDWLRYLPKDNRDLRKLVYVAAKDQGEMPAPRIRWKKVVGELVSTPKPRTLARRYEDAIKLISKRLNEDKRPLHTSIYLLLEY